MPYLPRSAYHDGRYLQGYHPARHNLQPGCDRVPGDSWPVHSPVEAQVQVRPSIHAAIFQLLSQAGSQEGGYEMIDHVPVCELPDPILTSPTYHFYSGWNDYRAGLLLLLDRKIHRSLNLALVKYHAAIRSAISIALTSHLLATRAGSTRTLHHWGNFWYILGVEEGVSYFEHTDYREQHSEFPLETFQNFPAAADVKLGEPFHADESPTTTFYCDVCHAPIVKGWDCQGLLVTGKLVCHVLGSDNDCLSRLWTGVQSLPEFQPLLLRPDSPLTTANVLSRFESQPFASPHAWRTYTDDRLTFIEAINIMFPDTVEQATSLVTDLVRVRSPIPAISFS